MGQSNELLKFLIKQKIPLRQAMMILEQAEKILQRKVKEKAIIEDYEKRGGSPCM